MAKNTANETTEMTVSGGFSEIANLNFLSDAMSDECAGLEFSLDRVKIPSGGMTAFEVPTGDGETTDLAKEIDCVILMSHPANAYYKDAYQGGSNPPDCGSFDGITGSSGQSCKTCPYNQFGSGTGKAKACRNRRMLYLLRENELFPLMLNLPTGSLKSFTKYVQSLLTRGKRPHQVVTKISLRKASSSTDIDYSQAVFKCVRILDAKEQANIDAMIEQVRVFANNLTVSTMAAPDDAPPFVDPETGEVIEPLK